jgi:hypothetical protein
MVLAVVALEAAGQAHMLWRSQQTPQPSQQTPKEFTGDVATLTLDRPDDAASGGAIGVGRERIAIPSGLAIELPARVLTLPEVFSQATAPCRKRGQSGLARQDACRADVGGADLGPPSSYTDTSATPVEMAAPVARATVLATRTDDGRLVAVSVKITKSREPFWGAVTYVDVVQGYLRVNGALREDDGGVIVRINDPEGLQSDQHGVGCGPEGNCSPDARFRLDGNAYSVRFARGNPACIGSDAQACPEANRHIAADDFLSRVPIRVGDNVQAEGAFEIAAGVRFFSAQALVIQTELSPDR